MKAGWSLAVFCFWAVAFCAALEVWARADLLWTSHRNGYVQRLRARGLGYAAALDSTLWAKPWHSYRPGLDVQAELPEGRFVFRTDEYGFRNLPVTVPKPDSVYRIVCVGGSTTVEGLSNETTYPARLQAILRDRLGTARIEVINCGISGITSQMEAMRAGDYLVYEPDLVLEYNGVNDLWNRVHRFQNRLTAPESWFARSLWFRERFSSALLPPEGLHSERWRTNTIRHLRRLADRIQGTGAEIVFATFARPDPGALSRSERAFFNYDLQYGWEGQLLTIDTYSQAIDLYNRELSRFGRQRSIRVLPVHEDVRGGSEHFVDVCHMTPEGIQAKAESVARHLEPIVRLHLQKLDAK